jgi:hypothetical protein
MLCYASCVAPWAGAACELTTLATLGVSPAAALGIVAGVTGVAGLVFWVVAHSSGVWAVRS